MCQIIRRTHINHKEIYSHLKLYTGHQYILESTMMIFKKVILLMATNHCPDDNGPIPNVKPTFKRFKMK